LKRFTNLWLALISSILLWAAWPMSPLTPLIFIAFVPLLWIESTGISKRKFLGLTYITMFIWNVATTWWIWNASVPGALSAFIANSFLMCIPWLGYSIFKRNYGERIGYGSLIIFWLCFEYLHLQDWGLSWPWLTLGNVFATHPGWVQWYEYTGTSGGSLWIMLMNVLLFKLFVQLRTTGYKLAIKKTILPASILLLPFILSLIITNPQPETGNLQPAIQNIVIVQPNIDPYEKIYTGSFESQLGKLISLSEKQIDSNTSLVIWPETALFMPNGIEEDKMKTNYLLNPLWGFLQKHPGINLFTGIESYRSYKKKETPTAKEVSDTFFYDAFNSSILLDSSGTKAFYHKSMLVPGVETLPWFLKFIDTWFEKFGGTTAGYARQKDRAVLTDSIHKIKIAPSICYESIYGEFMSKYINNGANLICIITNDGWWKNTPGHKQHMSYARLRAIETRTWVARSANTGISCFIDPNGNVYESQPWDKAASIKKSIALTSSRTFFVRNGDITGRAAVTLSILLLTLSIFIYIKNIIQKR
jgi:apolipoprotein N-acyltransferase